jgi:hypothetical protein
MVKIFGISKNTGKWLAWLKTMAETRRENIEEKRNQAKWRPWRMAAAMWRNVEAENS